MRTEPLMPAERTRLVEFAESITGNDGAAPGADLNVQVGSLLQQILAAPGSVVRQLGRMQELDGLQIVARSQEPLPTPPLPGDIVLRIIEGGAGHAFVVASPGLVPFQDLNSRGLSADSQYDRGYIHVVEPSPFARRGY